MRLFFMKVQLYVCFLFCTNALTTEYFYTSYVEPLADLQNRLTDFEGKVDFSSLNWLAHYRFEAIQQFILESPSAINMQNNNKLLRCILKVYSTYADSIIMDTVGASDVTVDQYRSFREQFEKGIDKTMYNIYSVLLNPETERFMQKSFGSDMKSYISSCHAGMSEMQFLERLFAGLNLVTAQYNITKNTILDVLQRTDLDIKETLVTNSRQLFQLRLQHRYNKASAILKRLMVNASTGLWACGKNVDYSSEDESQIYSTDSDWSISLAENKIKNPNEVVVGARLNAEDNVIWIQLQTGSLLPNGQIDHGSVSWKPIDKKIRDRKIVNSKYLKEIEISNSIAQNPHVAVGFCFKMISSRIKISIISKPVTVNPWKLDSGKLKYFYYRGATKEYKTKYLSLYGDDYFITEGNQFFKLTNLKEIDIRLPDRTEVPYLDLKEVTTNPTTLISGIGLYVRNDNRGEVLALKLHTFDFTPYIANEVM